VKTERVEVQYKDVEYSSQLHVRALPPAADSGRLTRDFHEGAACDPTPRALSGRVTGPLHGFDVKAG